MKHSLLLFLFIFALTTFVGCNSQSTSDTIIGKNCGTFDTHNFIENIEFLSQDYAFVGTTTMESGEGLPENIKWVLKWEYSQHIKDVDPDINTGYLLTSSRAYYDGNVRAVGKGYLQTDYTITEIQMNLVPDNTLCQQEYGEDATYNEVLLHDIEISYDENCNRVMTGTYYQQDRCESNTGDGDTNYLIYRSRGTFRFVLTPKSELE